MELTLDTGNGMYQIRSYQPEMIQVNEQTLTSSFIVTPSQLIYPWQPQSFSELTLAHFEIVFALKPEVVILGTGPHQIFSDPSFMVAFANHHIGFEIMNTSAACRTYNILMTEGRLVAAAMLFK